MGSLLAAALTRAHDFLLEPVEAVGPRRLRVAGDGNGSRALFEVSVLGTCAGCGVSTVASGLELMLAASDRPAAIVRDVACSAAERHEVVTHRAGAVVVVTPGSGHPPIAELVGSLLKERVARLLLVANRVSDEDRWNGHADLCLPESRLGAALVSRGHRPTGPFGAALAQLAAMVERGPER